MNEITKENVSLAINANTYDLTIHDPDCFENYIGKYCNGSEYAECADIIRSEFPEYTDKDIAEVLTGDDIDSIRCAIADFGFGLDKETTEYLRSEIYRYYFNRV